MHYSTKPGKGKEESLHTGLFPGMWRNIHKIIEKMFPESLANPAQKRYNADVGIFDKLGMLNACLFS